MADIQIIDPLGRMITLHERTWYGHIVKFHPEVKDDKPLVENAIRDPDEIRYSQSNPDCRLYYGRGPRSTVKIQVVEEVVLGIVKTAHLAKRTSGGAVEWLRPTH